MNEQGNGAPSITEEYERKALAAFKAWYQRTLPTMWEAADEADPIARETAKGLTTTHVILLLQEQGDYWIQQKPQETYDSDKTGVTIGEIARRHLVRHLERVIQQKGFQVVCTQGQEQ